MTKAPFRIVILGGGTAGWIAANLFAHGWGKIKGKGRVQIAVVESPDIGSIGGYYSAISWHCLLAGYGTFPDDSRMQAVSGGDRMAVIDDFIARCGMNFPSHRDMLAALA